MIHPYIANPETDCSTLVDLLCWRAQYEPDKLAYTFLAEGEHEQGSLTYAMLNQQARAIAAVLQSICMPGDRALLLYPSGLEFISAFLGCLYAGIVAIPAHLPRKNHHLSRLEAIVGNAQAVIGLTTSQFIDVQSQASEQLALASLQWLATDAIQSDWNSRWRKPDLSSSTLAFLQYTSGSTGNPKGVVISHSNLLYNQQLIKTALEHGSKTVFVSWLPLFHDMGLIGNVLQALYLGRPCVFMPPEAFLQKPIRWLKAISDYRATTSGGPNLAYELCIHRITDDQQTCLDLSHWDAAFNGAEPIRAETLEHFTKKFRPCGFREVSFYPCYGMAEATLIVTGGIKAQPPIIHSVTKDAIAQNRIEVAVDETQKIKPIVGCGQSWLDQKILIVDPELSMQCQPSQVGEIWVSGPSIAQGYWNQQSETEKTFCAHLKDTGEGPFLRTGDLGFIHNSELFVTGRLKDLIIILGRNYYPQDIEYTVECSHPFLRPGCGAAFSVEIANREKLVIAHEVERSYFRNPNPHEVIGAIRRVINDKYGLPIHTILLLRTASLPKTSSGKVQRRDCRTKFLTESLEAVADWRALST